MIGSNKKEAHAFQLFHNEIKKGEISPVLLFYGQEDFLIDWAVALLKKRYVDRNSESMDYVKLWEDSTNADEILEACNTFSMLSEKRIIWAKDFSPLKNSNAKGFTKEQEEKLISYFEEPNEGAILILSSSEISESSTLVKSLKKIGQAFNFCQLDRASFLGFAEKRFKTAGVNIKKETLRYLIEETGYYNKESDYRLWNLENDIKKMIAHCENGVITEQDIMKTLRGDLDTFIFDFLDAISNNQKEGAFRLMHNLLSDGTDIFSIIAMMIQHFELILEVKEFKQEGIAIKEIVHHLKLHEFRIKKAMSYTDKFTVEKLKTVLIQLYEIDRKIKTGLIEQTVALELLVGRI